MPLIKVQASVAEPQSGDANALLGTLSARLAEQTGKPESTVMTAFEPNVPMTFAGTADPACYVEIKSVGEIPPEQARAMSHAVCQQIEQSLGVPANRTYITFSPTEGTLWGWNGSTLR
ncbi:MAG: hypothetical protein BRC58_04915 [Cyanobacteria bacterium QS_8_64_29]|nr:MAG: hypothetical protein BRC58_04915 [Cyanobacteria bacterium QS_8_64_29]